MSTPSNEPDTRPKRHGWAPGLYAHPHGCSTCRRDFWGDKRATTCADCAYAEPDATPSNENTCPRCGKAGDNKTLRGREVYPCGSRRYTAGVIVESIDCIDRQSRVPALVRAELVETNTRLAAAKAENERLKESEGQLSRELGFVRDANAEDLAELTTELTTIKAVMAQVKEWAKHRLEFWGPDRSHEKLNSLLTSTPEALQVLYSEPGEITIKTTIQTITVVLPRSGGK